MFYFSPPEEEAASFDAARGWSQLDDVTGALAPPPSLASGTGRCLHACGAVPPPMSPSILAPVLELRGTGAAVPSPASLYHVSPPSPVVEYHLQEAILRSCNDTRSRHTDLHHLGAVALPPREQTFASDSEEEDDGARRCAICLLPMIEEDSSRPGGCLHSFHQWCLVVWSPHRTCPLCRTTFDHMVESNGQLAYPPESPPHRLPHSSPSRADTDPDYYYWLTTGSFRPFPRHPRAGGRRRRNRARRQRRNRQGRS